MTPGRIDELIRESWSSDSPPDYSVWVNAIINDPDSPTNALRTTLNALSDENRSQIFARQFLEQFRHDIRNLNNDQVQVFCEVALECLQVRTISFEHHVNALKIQLTHVYEQTGQFVKAAETLNTITAAGCEDVNRLDIYLQIVKLYLRDPVNDPVKAENALNRATAFLNGATEDQKLVYQVSHAKILDLKQKFLDAAAKYFQLSVDFNIIAEEERSKCLLKAINCAILSPAGKNRTRLISAIYKDSRASQMLTFGLLKKVFMQQIIAEKEIHAFSSLLSEKHYQEKTSEGWTLVEKAMKEHNILAISLLYKSICFRDLGRLLNIPDRQAEKMVATMILEKRLSAELDQVDEYIRFEHESQEVVWNESIRDTCNSLQNIVDKIQRKHPVWFEKTQRLVNTRSSPPV